MKSVRKALVGPRSFHSTKQCSHILLKASKYPTAILEPPLWSLSNKENYISREGTDRFEFVSTCMHSVPVPPPAYCCYRPQCVQTRQRYHLENFRYNLPFRRFHICVFYNKSSVFAYMEEITIYLCHFQPSSYIWYENVRIVGWVKTKIRILTGVTFSLLRTVAPIANAHIFCASRDSCMCSGAKNFRCIELLFLYFASVVGVLTRKWGTWNQNEMVDLWKNPGRRSPSACMTKKTNIDTSSQQQVKRGSTNCRTRRVSWTDLFFRGYLESDHLKRPRERQPFG